MDQRNPNPDLLANLEKIPREPLPDQKTFDLWHIKSLIEELDDIAQDLGMYKRMLRNPDLRPDNKALIKYLQELDDKRYWKLEAEIEELRNEYQTQDIPF